MSAAALLDDLIGELLELKRNAEAENLRGPQI
jgi:hypothetical protein